MACASWAAFGLDRRGWASGSLGPGVRSSGGQLHDDPDSLNARACLSLRWGVCYLSRVGLVVFVLSPSYESGPSQDRRSSRSDRFLSRFYRFCILCLVTAFNLDDISMSSLIFSSGTISTVTFLHKFLTSFFTSYFFLFIELYQKSKLATVTRIFFALR